MAKKDFRLYCEEEYIDHLKMVADEKGTLVRSVGDVKVGDGIRLRLSDGTLETTVKSKKEI